MHPTRIGRAMLAALIAVPALAAGLLLPASAVAAAELPGAITSVTTDKSSYGYSERLKLTFAWAVPDSAVAGDAFALTLPDELKAVSLAKFTLLAPDGSVVANASWDGKSVDFILTDYVDTHDGVGGSGFLTVQWDHTFTPVTSQPVILEFDSNVVEVIIGPKPAPPTPCTENCPPPPATPTSRSLSKGGGWADGAFEGTRDASNNINWTIALPGNPVGFAGPITIVDTPTPGSIIECATVKITRQDGLAGSAVKTVVDPARYTIDCSASTATIVLDAIAPNEFVTITYKGTITDQAAGRYGNHVEVTIAGTTTIKDSVVKRTDAGGVGEGVQSVSVGDYVWLDANRDGIQDSDEDGIPGVTLTLTGPDGAPVTTIGGQPVGPTVTGADGDYTFANLPLLPVGTHYTVTIDADASATALDGLASTKEGVGDDRAADSSTDSAESIDLTINGARDSTLDFGFIVPELPTLPLPEDPTTPAGEPIPAGLAHTGLDGVTGVLALALGLVVLGLASAVAPRLRRR